MIRKFFAPLSSGRKPGRGILLIGIVGAVSIFILPWLLTRSSLLPSFYATGQVGDTINGVAGPFISIAASIITFLAFFAQYNANKIQLALFKEQKKQFERQLVDQETQFERESNNQNTLRQQQERTWLIDRFETKYFELLKFHRTNVTEMEIRGRFRGRRVFVEMYNEFRFCFYLIRRLIEKHPSGTNHLDLGFEPSNHETIVKLAYLIFFYGNGDKSDKILLESTRGLCTMEFLIRILEYIEAIQRIYRKRKNHNEWYRFKIRFNNEWIYTAEVKYKPFDGHISRLGHYYRHLFQTVEFVAEYDKVELKYEDKYSYIKTLRAQLSSHEQVMLYYNTLLKFGIPWLDKDNPYLTKYKIIKNLPLPLADFGIKPEIRFKNEIIELAKIEEHLFEWHEYGNQEYE